MVKKLTRHGNSSALIIDRPILDLLKIDEDTPLEISTDGKRLIIEPAQDSGRAERFTKAVNEADREYGRMFKRLAE
jgi:antitoxin component of MazEF toxin-antitoxin module